MDGSIFMPFVQPHSTDGLLLTSPALQVPMNGDTVHGDDEQDGATFLKPWSSLRFGVYVFTIDTVPTLPIVSVSL